MKRILKWAAALLLLKLCFMAGDIRRYVAARLQLSRGPAAAPSVGAPRPPELPPAPPGPEDPDRF